ncbi:MULTISPECIES: CHAT domain-containing protein [unclassified Nonomuraea]|uniref:CHAT domain-containing protein n=1 Tax=unclassified Nonomuraea TaxID=2593643 RepID=UPI00340CD422
MTTILAEYLVTDQTTLLFVVRHDEEQPHVEQIDITRAQVGDLVARGPAAASPPAALDALVAPLDRHCQPDDTIWFVPHNVLHYLPLHALRLGDGRLIDRNPVCYTPSASVMRYCQAKRRPDSRRVLVYADPRADMPLVHAREQAAAIARLFGGEATLRMGAQAAVTALEKDAADAADGFRVVHLACHGRYDPERPLRSGVLLAPDGVDDGELSAERILTMSLPADLVTISACESGANARHPGDELIGLTRALIYAGAASVLVSLWAVDEVSTSLLMQHFYRELLSGTDKAEALRRAQRRLRDMTAAEVVGLCERAASAAGEDGLDARLLLEESIADVRFRARDYAGAQAAYERLLPRVPQDGPWPLRLEMGETRSRWAATAAGEPADYERKIYEDPYHWAPFILVGDWR